MMNRMELIDQRLRAAFAVQDLDIVDDSAAHAGHVGARDGGGHFNVTVVAEIFAGKSRIERHRMVYEALSDLMQKQIHALSIKAFTPEEL